MARAAHFWQPRGQRMVYYKNEPWLLLHGVSYFSARITPKTRKWEDICWSLDMQFISGSPIWRRVQMRPRIVISLSSFQVPGPSWKDLGRVNYWSEAETEMDAFKSGFLNVSFWYHQPEEEDWDGLIGCNWRVVRRDAGWLTLEMAVCGEGATLPPAAGEKTVVLIDGTEETAPAPEPDEAFWRGNTALYLLEAVPFGIVHVLVPRNARDVEAHAIARARELLGVGEPEHVEVQDYFNRKKPIETLQNEVHVALHFHGHHTT